MILSPDVLMAQMAVTPEEIKQYYADHSAQYLQREERQASHILITVKPDAAEADKKAAKEKRKRSLRSLARPGTIREIGGEVFARSGFRKARR